MTFQNIVPWYGFYFDSLTARGANKETGTDDDFLVKPHR